MSTIRILVVISLIISSFVLGSCSKKEESQFENYVHEPLKSSIKGMDPVISSDLYSGIVMGQIYSTLLQYNYLQRPIIVEPLDADGMPQISKDQKTYTFKIKKGLMFHDSPVFKATSGKGREVTAEDYIYSWKRLADPSAHSDGFWVFEGKVKGFKEWRDEAVKLGKANYSQAVPGLTAVDQHTLKIELEKPYPQLLFVLTMIPAAVLPHEAIEFHGPEFQNNPVGSGPYKFHSWVRNSTIVLDRNPNYMNEVYPSKGEPSDSANGNLADAGKKLPLNEGVVFTETVEDQPRFLNFRKGVFDWVEIPKDNFDSAVKNDELASDMVQQGVRLTKYVDPDVTFDSFNMDDPIVGGAKGKFLRQAISLTVDPAELIKKFYNDRAVPAHGPIPPSISGYDPDLKNPYKGPRLEKAKELLKKAGYPGGQGLPELKYETYQGSTARQIVEYLQQRASLIGVKIKINANTWPEFLQKQKQRKAQMFGMAWSADYPDAENFLQLFYGPNGSPGPNNSNYNNPEFNKLYEQASVMPDNAARNVIYRKMVALVVEDTPWIFDTHRKSYVLQNGWFHNHKRNLMNLNYIKYYRVDKEAKAQLKKKL